MQDQDSDPTEEIRRVLQARVNLVAGSREDLLRTCPEVWDTDELRAQFEVQGFMAPFVIVKRKSDGKSGTLMFQHSPRFYFQWDPK